MARKKKSDEDKYKYYPYSVMYHLDGVKKTDGLAWCKRMLEQIIANRACPIYRQFKGCLIIMPENEKMKDGDYYVVENYVLTQAQYTRYINKYNEGCDVTYMRVYGGEFTERLLKRKIKELEESGSIV